MKFLRALLLTTFFLSHSVVVAAAAENIARGCPYELIPQPNYKPTPTSPEVDSTKQLTDGKYTPVGAKDAMGNSAPNWDQPSTLGWYSVSPVLIIIDLKTVQPIGGLSFSAVAAVPNKVLWPQTISILVSDDREHWHYLTDLVQHTSKKELPPDHGSFRYVADDLHASGRYVCLAITNSRDVFCDEIEIFKGNWEGNTASAIPSAGASSPTVDGIEGIQNFVATNVGIMHRLWQDVALLHKELTSLDPALAAPLLTELSSAESKIESLPPVKDPQNFRAILPLNDLQEKLLGIHAAVLRAKGFPSFFAWKQHRYDLPNFYAIPPNPITEEPKLSVEMMGNEHRADAFLLTNASDKPVQAALQIEGLPGSPHPAWLHVSQVLWTDTDQAGVSNIPQLTASPWPVADALVDPLLVGERGETMLLTLPPGLTQKIWLDVDSSQLPVGNYQGKMVITTPGATLNLPIMIRVSPVAMGRPRLSLGVFDYTAGNGQRAIHKENMTSAMALLQSHLVDTPVASGVLPLPVAEDFDAFDKLKQPPDFSALDAWIKRWPNARNFMISWGWMGNGHETRVANDHFAGAKFGTKEFQTRLTAWEQAFIAHIKSLHLKPQQFILWLVDEPQTDSEAKIIVDWIKAIKSGTGPGGDGLKIWEDPVWERPDQVKNQEALTLPDIICPDNVIYLRGGAPVAKYFADRRAAGQKFWFYVCSGPTRLFDPDRYYRLEAWRGFQSQAEAINFWSFVDSRGPSSWNDDQTKVPFYQAGPTSWNEYGQTRYCSFTPVFISPDQVTGSLHWEAVREGVEDHEYLSMLQDLAAKTTDPALKAEAVELLTKGVDEVCGAPSPHFEWVLKVDRDAPDVLRLKALNLLEKASEGPSAPAPAAKPQSGI